MRTGLFRFLNRNLDYYIPPLCRTGGKLHQHLLMLCVSVHQKHSMTDQGGRFVAAF